MPTFISKANATGVYWHFPEQSGIIWHILAFSKKHTDIYVVNYPDFLA